MNQIPASSLSTNALRSSATVAISFVALLITTSPAHAQLNCWNTYLDNCCSHLTSTFQCSQCTNEPNCCPQFDPNRSCDIWYITRNLSNGYTYNCLIDVPSTCCAYRNRQCVGDDCVVYGPVLYAQCHDYEIICAEYNCP